MVCLETLPFDLSITRVVERKGDQILYESVAKENLMRDTLFVKQFMKLRR